MILLPAAAVVAAVGLAVPAVEVGLVSLAARAAVAPQERKASASGPVAPSDVLVRQVSKNTFHSRLSDPLWIGFLRFRHPI